MDVDYARRPMLTKLELQNYRGHEATEIPLSPLTVLIGPNAVGKSSALEALCLLGRLIGEAPEKVLTGSHELRWLRRRGATEGDFKIAVSALFEQQEWTAHVVAAPSHEPTLSSEPRRLSPRQLAAICGATTLRLDSRRLAEPSTSTEEEPRLAEDGYGLATVLSALKLSSTDRFRNLEEAACRVVPSLKAIGFKRTKIERPGTRTLVGVDGQKVVVAEREVSVADELVLDFADAAGLPAHAASEGTLIVLGILATLYGPATPGLLLLEDIERALHPQAQKGLVDAVKLALVERPETQIVATTHSPYLVDALAPEEVVVLGRGPTGDVAARRLSDHPRAQKLLEVLTAGELWTAEGEDWGLSD